MVLLPYSWRDKATAKIVVWALQHKRCVRPPSGGWAGTGIGGHGAVQKGSTERKVAAHSSSHARNPRGIFDRPPVGWQKGGRTLKCLAPSLGAVRDTSMSGARAGPSHPPSPFSTCQPEGMSTDTTTGGLAAGTSACSSKQLIPVRSCCAAIHCADMHAAQEPAMAQPSGGR